MNNSIHVLIKLTGNEICQRTIITLDSLLNYIQRWLQSYMVGVKYISFESTKILLYVRY